MKLNKISLFLLCLLLASCEPSPQKYAYEEKVLKKPLLPVEMMTDDPHSSLRHDPAFKAMFENNGQDANVMPAPVSGDVVWTTPPGWKTKPGGGFRLVSFTSADPLNEIDVSIVKLEGPAGGIKPNLVRWMGQINVPAPADADLDGFLAKQKKIKTAEGVEVIVIDFAQMQGGKPDATPSMLAAIIEQPDYKLFIKMTGTMSAIKHHRGAFLSLCESLKINK